MTRRSNLEVDHRAKAAAPAEQPLAGERAFYADYPWSLNPLCTAGDVAKHLNRELAHLGTASEPWCRDEVMTNIFLLAGALLTAAEDALHGPVLRLPQRLTRLPGTRLGFRTLSAAMAIGRAADVHALRHWRDRWQAALANFLQSLAVSPPNAALDPAGA
ncbi:MAG: hypothetical protein ACREEA_07485, partial [Stellaceae bacterium]